MIKRFVLIVIATLFTGSSVLALSQDQADLYGSGIYYFDGNPSDCSAVSGETGSGPLFGLGFPDVANPSDLVNRIDTVIQTYPSSPLINDGAQFVASGQKYGVNPALVAAIAGKEDGFATANQPVVTINKNAFGYTAIPGFPVTDGYADFSSIGFTASIDVVTKQIDQDFVQPTGTYYSTTVAELMHHYSSSPDATAATLSFMHKFLDGIAETSGSPSNPSFTPGSTTPDQCTSSGGYQAGANGYNLDNMAHFYQCDPQWANSPYGPKYAGDPSETICMSGCGITSMSMVVATLSSSGSGETPLSLANKYGNAYHDASSGTSFGLWPAAASDYGLKYQSLGTDLSKAAAIIRQGGLVIISVDSGAFTSGSHLMVIRAVDDQGNFYLADPNNLNGHNDNDESKGFSASYLTDPGQGHMIALFGFTK